ncbi:hypothetical protein EUGRSUZ_E03239 [Eucalyptus grandis]|uniref:Uncharacterized protein n=2 Tax=Eucalyptus grandis TaxID=71139 RepID=A0ACC3KY84_EUCGR|nr:hypothetical protein EUGRSUZ_E03239 [Eucalyptus grandis]
MLSSRELLPGKPFVFFCSRDLFIGEAKLIPVDARAEYVSTTAEHSPKAAPLAFPAYDPLSYAVTFPKAGGRVTMTAPAVVTENLAQEIEESPPAKAVWTDLGPDTVDNLEFYGEFLIRITYKNE